MTSKMKPVPYSDVSEVDSGMMSHVMSRMPNGPYTMDNLPLAGDHTTIYGGQIISPTHPQGPVHFMPPQVRVKTASILFPLSFYSCSQILVWKSLMKF